MEKNLKQQVNLKPKRNTEGILCWESAPQPQTILQDFHSKAWFEGRNPSPSASNCDNR